MLSFNFYSFKNSTKHDKFDFLLGLYMLEIERQYIHLYEVFFKNEAFKKNSYMGAKASGMPPRTLYFESSSMYGPNFSTIYN
jgi:hypothetical protein